MTATGTPPVFIKPVKLLFTNAMDSAPRLCRPRQKHISGKGTSGTRELGSKAIVNSSGTNRLYQRKVSAAERDIYVKVKRYDTALRVGVSFYVV